MNAPENGAQRVGEPDNGVLERSDVGDSPIERGTDALGDDAGARRFRSTGRLVLVAVLMVVFGTFLIQDVVNQSWGRAALGGLVLVLCGLIVQGELKKPKR